MDLKTKWLFRIVLAVVLVCLAVFIIFSVRSCSAERDAPSSEQTEETPAADAQEPDEPEKTEQAQEDEEESGPLMTLTDEELAYYLDQVEWDDNFQAYIDADTEQHDDPYFYQKLYLELNPDITIPGFGNPYGEGAAFVDVEAIQMYDAQDLRYNNHAVSYAYNADGDTISVGVSDPPEGEEGIWLVPSISTASETNRVGFYFLDDAGNVETLYDSDTPCAAGEGINEGENTFLIVSRTYDYLVPANAYTSATGAVWRDNGYAITGTHVESATVYGRAVNIDTGKLLATFRVEIAYADGVYTVTDIYDSEAVANGDLTRDERTEVITDALVYLLSRDRGPYVGLLDSVSNLLEGTIVEKLPTTYFPALYDENANPMSQGDIPDVCDVYAVNIPAESMGFITVYYSPALQLLSGFEKDTGPDDDNKNLTLFGFDSFTPFSQERLLTINGFEG